MDTDPRVEAVARLAARNNWTLIGDSGRGVMPHHEQIAEQILAAADAVDDGWEPVPWYRTGPKDSCGEWKLGAVALTPVYRRRRSVTPSETP